MILRLTIFDITGYLLAGGGELGGLRLCDIAITNTTTWGVWSAKLVEKSQRDYIDTLSRATKVGEVGLTRCLALGTVS